jgi:deazaflavin-dependent oxidoreductase (nitroreductase family)
MSGTVMPTLVLVNRGRKSGREYRTPLLYIHHRNGWAVTASNHGQAKHPEWSANLIADGNATLRIAGEEIRVRARLASPDELLELWPMFFEFWPAYRTYIRRAGNREIRLFILNPSNE